jgi:AcrR family transcriptional regulator
VVRELPRRAHDLPARTVRASQRWRLLEAVTEAVARGGYAAASVADVIAIAGVSRKTFYEHFDDKEDCFLAAYDVMSARFAEALAGTGKSAGDAAARTEARVRSYVRGMAREPAMARAFIVEVLGAGPRALTRRERVNARFAELLLGESIGDALVRKAVLGGVNDVVAGALLSGDGAELMALVGPLGAFVRRVVAGA